MIVDWFGFMRRNHPRFGAQVAGRRYHRNAAGTVMSPVATRTVAAAVAIVVRLLCLAHVLGRHSGATGHDTTIVSVVRLPAATMMLLLVGQWNHVMWSQGLLVMVYAAGRNTRMVVVSVVVDPRSLGRHIWWRHARQMRKMGWRWWRVAQVLGRCWVSVHHRGCFCCCYFIYRSITPTHVTGLFLLAWLAIVKVDVPQL